MIQKLGIGNQNGEVIQNGKGTIPGDKIGAFIPLLLGAYGTERKETDMDGLSPEEKEEKRKRNEQLFNTSEETEAKKTEFYDARKKLQGYDFPEDKDSKAPGLKPGTCLMVGLGNLSLPPYETKGQDRMKMTIETVNDSEGWIEVKCNGATINADKKYEGITKKIYMHPDTLSHFQQYGPLLKLPDPDAKDVNNPNDHLKKIKNIGFLSKGLSAFDPLEWDDGKKGRLNRFGDKEQVEYFGYQERIYKGEKPDKKNIVYKVTYSPSSKTFKVSNDGFPDKNQKDEYAKRDKEMDYNSFLLFIADLKLQPRKKSEAEAAQKRNHQEAAKIYNSKKRNRFLVSCKTIKNVFKGQFKKIQDKLDQRQKDNETQFEDFMLDDVGLHNLIVKTLGWIPSVKNAMGELQQERFNEKDNRIRKKIEGITKVFDADPRFSDVFEETPDFVHTLFGEKSYKQFLIDGFNSAN